MQKPSLNGQEMGAPNQSFNRFQPSRTISGWLYDLRRAISSPMWDGAVTVEILLRGVAVGTLLATAIAFGLNAPSRSLRLAGALLSVSIIGYAVNSSEATRDAAGPLALALRFLSWGGVGALWAFALALFEDRKASAPLFSPYAGLTAFGLVASLLAPAAQSGLWIVHNLIEAALAAHILFVIYRSWRGDLVEARRRLRGPFIASIAVFAVILSAFEIGEDFGVTASWYPLAGASALAALSLAGALVMLQLRQELFGAAVPAVTPPGLNAADLAELKRLNFVMDNGEVWRREGLSIGSLAEELRIPEHRLRRLINDHLGHRNFAAFVNTRRIDAAKRMLADPMEARKTVASVAFDLGFGSLGPFNRAFKEATGQTPTEWRRKALAEPGRDD